MDRVEEQLLILHGRGGKSTVSLIVGQELGDIGGVIGSLGTTEEFGA